MYYLCSKNNGAFSFSATLQPTCTFVFAYMQKTGLLMTWLILNLKLGAIIFMADKTVHTCARRIIRNFVVFYCSFPLCRSGMILYSYNNKFTTRQVELYEILSKVWELHILQLLLLMPNQVDFTNLTFIGETKP